MKSSLGTFTLFVVCISLTPAPAAEFIQLGYLPGHEWSRAYGVSDDGTIVAGSSNTSFSTSEPYDVEAFRWSDATGMVGLGKLPGGERSIAGENGMSPLSRDGTTIVGYSYDEDAYYTRTAFVHDAARGLRRISTGQPHTDTSAGIVSSDGAVRRWDNLPFRCGSWFS